jgi:hypothetical protein
MKSQNTICAIFGIAVPTHKGNRGRLLPTSGRVTFGGHIVPIRQGALVRELFDPVGVLRR